MREEDLELVRLLRANEGFKIFMIRCFPCALALTSKTIEIGRKQGILTSVQLVFHPG